MKHGTLQIVALTLLVLAVPATAVPATPPIPARPVADAVVVAGDRQLDVLDERLQLVEDPGGRIDPERVLDNPDNLAWVAATSRELHPGPSRSRWWLRVDLDNVDDLPRERVLMFRHPTLDDVRFALLCHGGYSDAALSGDMLRFSERALPDRHPAFAFTVPAHDRCALVVAISSADAIHFPASLMDRTTYAGQQQRDYLLRGLGLGMQVLIVLLSVFVAGATRRWRPLRLAVLVASHAFLILVVSDLGYEFLWGEWPRLQKALTPVAISLAWWLTADFALRMLPAGAVPATGRLLLQGAGLAAMLITLLQVLVPDIRHLSLLIVTVAAGMVLLLALTIGGILMGAARAGLVASAIGVIALATLAEAGEFLGTGLASLPYLVPLHAGLLLGALLFAVAQPLPGTRPSARQAPLEHEVNRRVAERTHELATTVAQLRQTNRQLDRLSVTDQLTGTFNRRFMDNTLARTAAANRDGPLSFILFDIDYFKQVNDRHGHQVGDRTLRAVADCVQQQLRDGHDILCRYGGEEFAVILPDTDLAGAMAVAEKIRAAVAGVEIRCSPDVVLKVTVSLGVSTLKGRSDLETLVGSADRALYDAKRTGRNRWQAAG